MIGNGFPSNQSSWRDIGTTLLLNSHSSRSTTLRFSNPSSGKDLGWGVCWTCCVPKIEAKGASKKDLPSPPERPTQTNPGTFSERPDCSNFTMWLPKATASTPLAANAHSAARRHCPLQMQGSRATPRSRSKRGCDTKRSFSPTPSQAHTSSMIEDNRWRTDQVNLKSSGVACCFTKPIRRSAAQ